MAGDFVPPTFEADAFNCPRCHAFSHQSWGYTRVISTNSNWANVHDGYYSHCSRCSEYSFWWEEKLVVPDESPAPPPNEDMPDDVTETYKEAMGVLSKSPRASAALLRLAIQQLMPHLEQEGKDLNADIGKLVEAGLSPKIKEALDGVRVVGNNAVHPGVIDLTDNQPLALRLFGLVNVIIETTITRDKHIDEVYGLVPDGQLEGIAKRDGEDEQE